MLKYIRNIQYIIIFFLCLICTVAKADIAVESTFYMRYVPKQGWIIYLETKSSSLCQGIQELNPNLKGVNLNSPLFKQSTFDYFNESIIIRDNQNKRYNLKGVNINFGGLITTGSLILEKLPNEFKILQIKANCFTETNQHITNHFIIDLDGKNYKFKFNEKETQAIFNRDAKEFYSILNDDEMSSNRYLYIATIPILLLLVGTYLYRKEFFYK